MPPLRAARREKKLTKFRPLVTFEWRCDITHIHTYTHTYTHTTNRVCARANARFEFNAVQIVQTRRRRASEGGGERIEFFSFCHHHPFDPAFADILSLPPSLWKKERAPVDRPVSPSKGMDAPLWTGSEGRGWNVERERGKKRKKYVADVTRACGSARLGSAPLGSLDWKFSKRFSGIRFRGRGTREGGRG